MKVTINDFNDAVAKITDAIENAASIIRDNETLRDYFYYACKTVDDETDYNQYLLKYIEDYYYDTNNVEFSYCDYMAQELTDEEIKELARKLEKDYDFTNWENAKMLILEDAANDGLI